MNYATKPFEHSHVRVIIGNYDDKIIRSHPLDADEWLEPEAEYDATAYAIVDHQGWRRDLVEMPIVKDYISHDDTVGRYHALDLAGVMPARHVVRGLLIFVDGIGHFVAHFDKGLFVGTKIYGYPTHHEDFDFTSTYRLTEY